MSEDESQINIFKALDWIRDHAVEMAQAKANRVMLEEMRKSKKATLMKDAELRGHTTSAAQEREAYAHPDYITLLNGLKAAVEDEERLRWLMVAAQLKIECWRSLESTRRIEAKTL
ncbi:MAG TPA: hypothetical protein VJ652_15285 [Noviherbaspirillum sp.]|nr:hypothetical protein [Noviherbaspirillum sp.]